jgi:hypothetical protein
MELPSVTLGLSCERKSHACEIKQRCVRGFGACRCNPDRFAKMFAIARAAAAIRAARQTVNDSQPFAVSASSGAKRTL